MFQVEVKHGVDRVALATLWAARASVCVCVGGNAGQRPRHSPVADAAEMGEKQHSKPLEVHEPPPTLFFTMVYFKISPPPASHQVWVRIPKNGHLELPAAT